MSEITDPETHPGAEAWIRSTFDDAVKRILKVGVISGAMAEARPAWALPHRLVIGQIRESANDEDFTWIICGELPTDHISSRVASTPRDAARHVALKWQMNAEKFRDPEHRKKLGISEVVDWAAECDRVTHQAEELYAIADDDRIWQS